MADPSRFEHIGPLFMCGLPGPALDDSTRRMIGEFRVNNFILFARNIKNPSQVTKLCAAIRDECRLQEAGTPLIAIDQEGGTVARLPPPFTQFADARILAASPNPEEALSSYAQTCSAELKSIGVNINFAPVLDVCDQGRGLFMERRSLGSDPLEVGRLGRIIIDTMQTNGVAVCGKHFPGLGDAVLDPHELLPVVDKRAEEILNKDILPFKDAVGAGVATIMTSHTIYNGLDPDNPATMSKHILTDILRNKLGFNGVIVTDDLEMGAVENNWPVAQAALDSFQAGADLLLICHKHEKVENSIRRMIEAKDEKVISQARIGQSYNRIQSLRNKYA